MDRDPRSFRTFDGISLSYRTWGEGAATILLHGFMVDSKINWIDPGLIQPLVSESCRVIALDARGHGRSDKPHDPKSYAERAMARDVSALIDELGLSDVVLIGYSMGGYTALEAALLDTRVSAVAACGVGLESDEDHRSNPRIAAELTAETPPPDGDYRSFANHFGADRLALAAHLTGAILPQIRPEDMANIHTPVHIINGVDDLHDGGRLAALCPDATAVTVAGDHISTVADPSYRDALIAFLGTCHGK
jgi:pimeloyl-ACP methyl ester carboxylesterase